MSDFDDDLSLALRCSDNAARLAFAYFEAGVEVHSKSDGSVVTEADHAVEDLLRSELVRLAPSDALLGEERGRVGNSERVWILDPIDGTSFFSQGSPHFRVHVALAIRGRVEVGVVTAPAIGLQWWASRGNGAFESAWPRTGEVIRLAVSRTPSLDAAVLSADGEAGRARIAHAGVLAPASVTGWCGGLIQLLRGEIDGFLAEGHKVWDHAPWIVLVEEAGGRFTKRTDDEHGGGLYSNALLNDELLDAIGYPVVG